MNNLLSKQLLLQNKNLLKIHPAVSSALSSFQPVVALESTVLTHGLPYPENLNVATSIENVLREDYNVTPATIALRNGEIHVGLSDTQLKELCYCSITEKRDEKAVKVSTRDIPFFLQKSLRSPNQWGGTTVASTMHIASISGISTFVTGGTGGVHRYGEHSMDISSDLMELSRTPVLVVSAGIKSILDIGRTMEVLETFGVPVCTFGGEEFPAFFSKKSGVASPHSLSSVSDIAECFVMQRDLEMGCGMLVAVPNRSPAGEAVEEAIQTALEQAEEKKIRGRDVTPFVLHTVNELTQGESLQSNIQLLHNNARVGAQIAIEITAIQRKRHTSTSAALPSTPRVVVMGGTVLDIIAKPKPECTALLPSTSNPGISIESDGGVARNIASALSTTFETSTILYSAVGQDSRGTALSSRLPPPHHISTIPGQRTATYLAILDQTGDLYTAIADMEVMQHIPIPSLTDLQHASMLVLDANPPLSSLMRAAESAYKSQVPVFFEPTSVPKARIISESTRFLKSVTYASPDVDEFMAMLGVAPPPEKQEEYLPKLAKQLLQKMNPNEAYLFITNGKNGVWYAALVPSQKEGKTFEFRHFPVMKPIESMNNCTGAGDMFVAAMISFLLKNGKEEGKVVEQAIPYAIEMARKKLDGGNE